MLVIEFFPDIQGCKILFSQIENYTSWKTFFSVKDLFRQVFFPSKSVCRIFYSEVSHTPLKCQMVCPLSTCCFFEVLLAVAMLLKYRFLIPLVEHTPQISKYNDEESELRRVRTTCLLAVGY